jgi:hypothetical protein
MNTCVHVVDKASRESICRLTLSDHNNKLYSTRGFNLSSSLGGNLGSIIQEWQITHSFCGGRDRESNRDVRMVVTDIF